MQRTKRLTKKERKAAAPPSPQGDGHHHGHIHCTACGVHLDEEMFGDGSAVWIACAHGSDFASCVGCSEPTRELLAEHDRTGQPVRHASAWH